MELPVTKEQITGELRALGRYYLPAWRYSDGGYISALTDIFAEMTAENRALLPAQEERLRVLYLSMYGLERRDAKPAVGYVRVVPTSENAVHVRAGTRLGSEECEFAAASELYSSGAEVREIFSSGGGKLCRGGGFFDLTGRDLRQEYICFSAESLLESSGDSSCEIRIFDISRADQHGVSPAADIDPAVVRWEYLSGDGFVPVKRAEYSDGRFTLTMSEPVPLAEFCGVQGRWLRMSFTDGQALPKYSGKSVQLSASVSESRVQAAYFNDEKLPDKDFLPFGSEPADYDALYLRSDDCFSKRGASVTVHAELSFEKTSGTDSPQDIQWKNVIPAAKFQPKPPLKKLIQSCVWEYWNGRGWSRIFSDEAHSGDFADEGRGSLSLSFTCPEDVAPVTVGADEGLFIRCRIRELTRGYSDSMEYIMPRVKEFTAGFSYSGGTAPDCLYVSHDMALHRVDGELSLSRSGVPGKCCTYICLDRALPVGYSSFFFRLDTAEKDGSGLSWEACCQHGGRAEWLGISVSDRTDGLRESGMMTFSLSSPMQRAEHFGEDGFWLRVSAPEGRRPRRAEIFTDIVPVVQTSPQEPVGFVYSGQPLQLAQGNVCDAEVEVSGEVLPPDSYTLDRQGGRVIFDRGYQPELTGEPDITVRYSVTAGAAGNLPAGSIDRFLDPVPFVDRVYNPMGCFGGSDGESRAECIKRGTDKVRTLGRCISAGDIVSAALAADHAVRKARCVTDGGITLVLLTETPDTNAFRLTRRSVMTAVSGAMPFYLRGSLRVMQAEPIEVLATANITSDGDAYPQGIHEDICTRLREFLDPFTGGSAGGGFAIGEYPSVDEMTAVIAAAPHVRRVDSVQFLCRIGGKLLDYERCADMPFGIPVMGEPQLHIREDK